MGRPNVGKSTLVNRIFGSRTAIVHDEPGVTRDRLYLPCEWTGREFILIDTGGILPFEKDPLVTAVRSQAKLAVEEADAILFVVEGTLGLTEEDRLIARELLKSSKPLILVVNKTDKPEEETSVKAEFYGLGVGEPLAISAQHGLGIGELLDELVAKLPRQTEEAEEKSIRVAIVGRPNVGKSSIVNALLGKERMIVSDMAGTTRDAIDSHYAYMGTDFTLIDTAGIRRKSKVDYGVEQFSVVRSLKAIERADTALLVIDAQEKVTEQDQRLGGIIADMGKNCIIVVNKWDLIEKDQNTMNEFNEEIRRQLYFLEYAPIIYISAVTRQRLTKIFELIQVVEEESQKKVASSLLNEAIQHAVYAHQPHMVRGKRLRIYYATQAGEKPPKLIFFVNDPQSVTDDYRRYLESRIRESFGFIGTPLKLIFRPRNKAA